MVALEQNRWTGAAAVMLVSLPAMIGGVSQEKAAARKGGDSLWP